MTIPLLPIPHNWIDTVEHTRVWPTAVLVSRDGHEQPLALSLTPRETLRYRCSTVTVPEAMSVFAPILAAATAATSVARGQVRIPRWEDQLPLAASIADGATVLTLDVPAGDDAGYRRFVDGGEIALCIPGVRSVVTATLAASGAVGADTLTLATGVEGDWPAGTRVAPVSVGRLAEDIAGDRLTGTVQTVTIVVTLDTDLAGTVDIAEGEPGRAEVPVVASVTVTNDAGDGGDNLSYGMQVTLRAICRDANGVTVPPPADLVWTTDNVLIAPRVLDPASGVAFFENLLSSPTSGTVTVTEPESGEDATYSFTYFGGIP